MARPSPLFLRGPGALALAAALLALLPVSDALGAFTEEAQFGAGATVPVAWGDYDKDGDLDLLVGNYGQLNRLYRNEGDGTFVNPFTVGAQGTFAMVWGDYDNDGDLDVAVGNGGSSSQQNYLFRNEGDGTLAQLNEFGLLRTVGMAWGDYDNDGDLDLALGNGLLGGDQQNMLYVNNGDGTFTGEEQFGMGQSAAVVWGDCDGDGDLDLAVGNGGFGTEEQNYLYRNNGDGTFTEEANFGQEDTASLAWGDYDNDGDLDLAVGNWQNGPSVLYTNDGTGHFTGALEFGDRDTNTLSWGDFDNDGDLDMAVGNGDFSTADTNFIYVNEGGGVFNGMPEFGLGSTNGLAWGDYDGDGDLDVACGNEHHPTANYLYVNGENDADYLFLHLTGRFHDLGAGYSNRNGVGARVFAYEAGHVGEALHLLGLREISAQGGFSPQNAMGAHFGCPGRTAVDIRIVWPGSAGRHIVQDLLDVAVGQKLTVSEAGTFTSVAPGVLPGTPAGAGASLHLVAVPNPVRDHVRFQLAAPGAFHSARTIAIHDVTGRRVREIGLVPASGGDGLTAEWDGRGDDGEMEPSGVYYARVVGSRSIAPERFVLIR